MNKLGLLVGAALILGQLAFAHQTVTSVNVEGYLLGYQVTGEGLALQVVSGGCIGKKNFEVTLLKSVPPQVTVSQVSQDNCVAYLPYGQTVLFDYTELGIAPNSRIKLNVQSKLETIRINF